jgi:PAS domain S-box-containing protein
LVEDHDLVPLSSGRPAAESEADEERMRLALDAARMGSFVWFPQEDRTVPDARMRALLGVDPDGSITLADALSSLIHPDDRARYAEAVGRSIDAGGDGVLRQDIRFIYPDGTVRWIDVSARTSFDNMTGEPLRMAGVVSDVTDRIVAERARAHLAALVTSSRDAIVTLSVAGVITTWNSGAESMLGVAAIDAIGGNASQLIPERLMADTQAMFADCVAGGASKPREMQLLRSDGTTIDVSLAMSLIVADDGAVLGVSVVSRDVSAQKQADEQARVRQHAERRAQRHTEIVAKVLVAVEWAETRAERAWAMVNQIAPDLALCAAVHLPDGPTLSSCGNSTEWTHEYPMRIGAEIVGTLLIAGDNGSLDVTSADRHAALIEVAERCAVLLSQAERHEQEHEISLRLQHALLPGILANDDRLEVHAKYLPGSIGMEVGGDWYDSHHLPNGRLMVTVGDVVGHGLEAAAAMGRLRIALAAIAQQTTDPSDQLTQLDNFCHGPNGSDFVTACIASIDPTTGRMAYASAGHPPILLVDPDGTTTWLDDALSPPLGLAGTTIARSQQEIVIPTGATIVLYSDGLVERRNETLDAGLTRLASIAATTTQLSVTTACDVIVAELRSPNSRDDIALLLLRRKH